jgi:tRNA C32,U32 (ribose-2'-O)-methylase TrmJ
MHPTLNIAIKAARKAGDIILRYHNQIDLLTIEPQGYPSAVATARASGADDVLSNALVCNSLKEALQGAHLVIGASVSFCLHQKEG